MVYVENTEVCDSEESVIFFIVYLLSMPFCCGNNHQNYAYKRDYV